MIKLNTYHVCKRIAVATAAVLAVSASFTGCHSKIRSNVNVSSTAAVSSEADSAASEAVSSQAASAIILNTGSAENSNTASKNVFSSPTYSTSKSVFAKSSTQKETKISINNKNIVAPSIPKNAVGNSVVKITQIEGVDGSFYDPVINEKPVDFNKSTFTLGTFWTDEWNGTNNKIQENQRTSAIFKQIQKDYNCTIKLQAMGGDYLTQVMTARCSGKVYADIFECQTEMNDLFRNGNFQDLLTVKSVNAFKNQWDPVYTLCSSFKSGDYGVGLRYDEVEHNILLFNIDLVNKYNLGNFYGLAQSGKWTDDVFLQASQAFQKVNSDKTIYACDGLNPMEILALIYTNWTSPFGITQKKYIFNGQDSTVLDILSFAQNYVKKGLYNPATPKADWQADGTFKWNAGADATASMANFQTGKSLFYIGSDYILPSLVVNTKVHYGILPLPKGPSADDYTTVIRNVKYFSLAAQDPQVENAGKLLVALANRTNIRTADIVDYNRKLVQDTQSTAQLTQNYKYKQILNIELNASTLLPQIYYGAALKCVLQQQMTPKQAMDSIQTKAQTDINTTFGQS